MTVLVHLDEAAAPPEAEVAPSDRRSPPPEVVAWVQSRLRWERWLDQQHDAPG